MTDASPAAPASNGGVFIAVSLVLALVTFSFQWMMAGHAPAWFTLAYQDIVALALTTQVLWGVSVLVAFWKLRLRGWPVLLGAPLALFWIVIAVALAAACRNGTC